MWFEPYGSCYLQPFYGAPVFRSLWRPLRPGVTIQAGEDLTSSVALTAEGLRSDAPVTLSDTTLARGESATVTISTTKSTATGSYLLRLQGTHADPVTGLSDTRAATVKVLITRR